MLFAITLKLLVNNIWMKILFKCVLKYIHLKKTNSSHLAGSEFHIFDQTLKNDVVMLNILVVLV